jgi:hypothetical protein
MLTWVCETTSYMHMHNSFQFRNQITTKKYPCEQKTWDEFLSMQKLLVLTLLKAEQKASWPYWISQKWLVQRRK